MSNMFSPTQLNRGWPQTVDQALPTMAWERCIKDEYSWFSSRKTTRDSVRSFAIELECSLFPLFYKFPLVYIPLLSSWAAWTPCTLVGSCGRVQWALCLFGLEKLVAELQQVELRAGPHRREAYSRQSLGKVKADLGF